MTNPETLSAKLRRDKQNILQRIAAAEVENVTNLDQYQTTRGFSPWVTSDATTYDEFMRDQMGLSR